MFRLQREAARALQPAARVDLTETQQGILTRVRDAMASSQDRRVVFLVNTPFEESAQAVLGFLNSGRRNIVALKGPAGVYDEFYFDGHPKAISVPREILNIVGIEMPENGVLDPSSWSEGDRNALKEKILRLRALLPDLPLAAVEAFEQGKFATLKSGGRDDRKVEINDELTVNANAHIFDLIIVGPGPSIQTVRTYQNSPVLASDVRIMGIGQETMRNWRQVVEGNAKVITLGDMEPFYFVLNGVAPENRIDIPKEIEGLLSNRSLWDLRSPAPSAEVPDASSSSRGGIRGFLNGNWFGMIALALIPLTLDAQSMESNGQAILLNQKLFGPLVFIGGVVGVKTLVRWLIRSWTKFDPAALQALAKAA